MRKLMWFTIGFAISCALCAYALPMAWIIPLIVVYFVLSVVLLRYKKYCPMIVAFGVCTGLLWFSAFFWQYLSCAQAHDGRTVDIHITASGYSFESDYGVAFDAIVELEGENYPIRVYVNEKMDVSPGDTLRSSFLLRFTPPDGQEDTTYHAGKGVWLLAYQRGLIEHQQEANLSIGHYPARYAKMIKERLRILFPEDVFGFTQALLLGDASELDYAKNTALKVSGIRHIIAVSGLHVTMLYSLLGSISFRRRYLTAFLSLPVLVLFAAMAGFTPSVVRACIMIGMMILAQVLDQSYDAPTALSVASLVMLLTNPYVITSVGFQLTVGCVAGIQLFGEPVTAWMKGRFGEPKGKNLRSRILRGIISSVPVSLSAMSLTTPLSAIYFGTISLVGVLTNLLSLWIVNLVFCGLIVVCGLSFLSMSVASWLAWLLAYPIRLILWIADILSAFPIAAVYTRSPYVSAWLIFVYLLLAVFLLIPKRRPYLLTCCAAVGLGMALLCSWMEPKLDDVRMTVMDVGQGQSILIQSGGQNFLIDCGGDDDEVAADIAAETLLSMGIYRLDGIILTHSDRDHAGGVINLLSRIRTDRLLIDATAEEKLINGIKAQTDGEVVVVENDMILSMNEGSITIIGPLFVDNSNENSLCVLFDTENCDILITGDRGNLGEMMLLREYEIPDVDVLIAGHHGSKYSTTEELLRKAKPEIVMISVSADNPYGHPAPETLARLSEFGCRVFRTDIHGTITYRR